MRGIRRMYKMKQHLSMSMLHSEFVKNCMSNPEPGKMTCL